MGLATLYHATSRADEASRVLSDMLETTPTPDTYALASRVWRLFGDRRQAEAVAAEARHIFPSNR